MDRFKQVTHKYGFAKVQTGYTCVEHFSWTGWGQNLFYYIWIDNIVCMVQNLKEAKAICEKSINHFTPHYTLTISEGNECF